MAQSYADAISSIESGGRYGLLGPVTRSGDRAYGRYQVMGNNIGPWTREVLGQSLTPAQFLANPQAQDAVFNAKFGGYVQRYGPEGAARAWFAGPGGMNDPNRRDVLGTSVGDYGRRFMALFNGQPPVPPAPIPNLPGSPLDMAYFMKARGQPDLPLFAPQQPASAPTAQAPTPSFFSTLTPGSPTEARWFGFQNPLG
jgi:hypothetical protein